MSFHKTEAITIGQKPYSETSQILILYTPYFGKLNLLARGIHRHKNRLLSPPDLFTHSEIVFIKRSPKYINLLTEITIKDNFYSLRNRLECLKSAFYITGFLNQMTELEGEPNRELFDLSLDTLRSLMLEGRDEEMLILTFQIQALRYLGFMPSQELRIPSHEEGRRNLKGRLNKYISDISGSPTNYE